MKPTLLALLLLFLAACSYPVRPTPDMAAVGTSTQHAAKISGSWRLDLSDELVSRQDTVVPYTLHCSGMKYPIDVGHQLSKSTEQAMRSIFERMDAAENSTLVDGVVRVDLESFKAKVGCFAFMQCTADSQLALRISVRDQSGNVLVEKTVNQYSEQSGFEGLVCEGVATVLEKAISKNISDSLQRAITELADAPKIAGAN